VAMTHSNIKNIEDFVQHLINVGKVDSADRVIFHSINRQITKGIALTDRQHIMLKGKLEKYQADINAEQFKHIVDNLRMPLRFVNRAKTVEVSKLPEDAVVRWNSNSTIKDENWIKVSFPFHKKTIRKIEELVKQIGSTNYYHKVKSRDHYFVLSEKSVVPIIDSFRERNFDIEEKILNFYDEVKQIQESPQEFLPMFNLDQLVNVKQSVRDLIPQELLSDSLKMFDQRRRYGITDYGIQPRGNSLMERIVFRESTDFLSNPEEHNLQSVLDTVYNLNRYPLVVALQEKHAEDQIYEFYKEVKNYISDSEQSVLFRLEGAADFNRFVKDKNLNNWVDNNTKIVYISTNKLPKVLLNGEFNPITCFMYGSTANRYVDTYVQDRCDLIIFRDTDISPMRKYSNYYGNM